MFDLLSLFFVVICPIDVLPVQFEKPLSDEYICNFCASAAY